MKNFNPHHRITSWVAIIIIAAIGSTCVYFIWANANQSWAFEYVYPQLHKNVSKLITSIETIGWKTHLDEGYGFQLRHPAKYSKTITIVAPNSVLGTTETPVPGASIGPLVFVKAETPDLRAAANAKFNIYWNYAGKQESPTNYCTKQVLTNLEIRVASCLISGKKANYAFIKGTTFDIFVDGYSTGYDKKLQDTYGSAGDSVSVGELTQILSTFKFITPKI